MVIKEAYWFKNFHMTCIFFIMMLITFFFLWTDGLDDPQQCKNIRVKWLKDDQCAIIVGKVTPPQSHRSVKSCQMILGASSSSKFQFVQLTFDTFYINSCDIVLQISDSPSAQFDSKVRNLVSSTIFFPFIFFFFLLWIVFIFIFS